MSLIYSLILCLFFNAWSCQFQCVKDDQNTNISCVTDYGYNVPTVEFPPKILNGSQCTVEGRLVVCKCISRGNPLPPISWPLTCLTDFSVTSSSNIQTVKSIITMPAAHYSNITCISSNKLGRAEIVIPLQNNTEISKQKDLSVLDAFLPWIIAGVSLSLNLVLLIILIICAFKKGKHTQMEVCEEMNTYATLSKADVDEGEYGVISPQTT